MNRTTGVVLAAVVALSSAGVAVAADDRGSGRAATEQAGTAAERTRNFQKETLNLRDELSAKHVELDSEYDKANPDPGRISSLRKEIAELRQQIRAVADKHGVRTSGRDHGRGTMPDHDCDEWHSDDGRGCDCW